MKSLNPRQERFCHEYCIDCNATRAYRAAGYRSKVPQPAAARLLSCDIIQAKIHDIQQVSTDQIDARKRRIRAEYEKIAFQDPKDSLFDFTPAGPVLKKADDIDGALISSVSVDPRGGIKVRTWSKTEALDKLAKMDNMLTDRIDLTSGGQQIQVTPINIIYEEVGGDGEDKEATSEGD